MRVEGDTKKRTQQCRTCSTMEVQEEIRGEGNIPMGQQSPLAPSRGKFKQHAGPRTQGHHPAHGGRRGHVIMTASIYHINGYALLCWCGSESVVTASTHPLSSTTTAEQITQGLLRWLALIPSLIGTVPPVNGKSLPHHSPNPLFHILYYSDTLYNTHNSFVKSFCTMYPRSIKPMQGS